MGLRRSVALVSTVCALALAGGIAVTCRGLRRESHQATPQGASTTTHPDDDGRTAFAPDDDALRIPANLLPLSPGEGEVAAPSSAGLSEVRAPSKSAWLDVHLTGPLDGAPLDGFVVYASESGSTGTLISRSDSSGYAGFGPYYPTVVKLATACGGEMLVQIREGARTRVDFPIPEARRVVVRVNDSTGLPVAGAEVRVWREWMPCPNMAFGHTHSNGEFIASLATDSLVAVFKDGYGPSAILRASDFFLADGALVFVLSPGSGELSGMLRDPEGRPVSNVEVVLELAAAPRAVQSSADVQVLSVGVAPLICDSGSDGTFRFGNLPDNRVMSIGIRSRAYTVSNIRLNGSPLPTGRPGRLGPFQIQSGQRAEVEASVCIAGTLALRALDEQGLGIDEAHVQVLGEDGVCFTAESNMDGWCVVQPLKPGMYTIEGRTGNGLYGKTAVKVEHESASTVTLVAGARPGGVLISADGQTLSRWMIWTDTGAMPIDGRWYAPTTKTDAAGRFFFGRPGDWKGEPLVVAPSEPNGITIPAFRTSAVLDFERSQVITIPVEALPTCKIEIQATGSAVISLALSEDKFGSEYSIVLDNRRTITLGPLPPGSYRLERLLEFPQRELLGAWDLRAEERVEVVVPE